MSRDWQEIHFYGIDCSDLPWGKMQLGSAYSATVDLAGLPVLFQWSRKGPASAVAMAPGWYVKIREPLECQGAVPRVSVQVQGTHWASGQAAGPALDSVEGYLTGGRVGCDRKPGRTDFCADIWIKDGSPDAVEFVDALTRSGPEEWRTHLRKQDEIFRRLESGAGHSTRYIGARARLQIRVYRKDLAFKGSTAAAHGALWRSCGWDGTGAIVRVEFEVHRQWLREHTLDGKRLSDLNLDEWQAVLPALWVQLLGLVSWCPGQEGRKSRREESGLWAVLRAFPFEGVRCDSGKLRAAEIENDEDGLIDRIRRAVWSGQEAFGDEVLGQALTVARSPPADISASRERWLDRSKWSGHKERTQDDRLRRRKEEEEEARACAEEEREKPESAQKSLPY